MSKILDNEIDVIIEISAESSPVKYELEKSTNLLRVDRILQTPMVYPTNYGFIPNTLAKDGDACDALVISQYPLAIKSIIQVKIIGALSMEDQSGYDEKIVTLPVTAVDPFYDKINSIEQLPELIKKKIYYFFERYKDLDGKGKWTKIYGWLNREEAIEIVSQYKINKGNSSL